MKTIGIVAEYNPFHLGHKYQIEKAKELYNCDRIAVVMSGNFVQRGDTSIVDKYTRAEIAVRNGVDLVIELPFPYSCQNAELFSFGAINELKKLNVSAISFGCEDTNIDMLKKIANIQINNNDEYKTILRANISNGLSYPFAVNKSLNTILKLDDSSCEITLSPNNTLALEYIKSCKLLNFDVDYVPIKRHISQHNDLSITHSFASATAIRNELLLNNFTKLKHSIPSVTYTELKKYYIKNKLFNSLDNYLEFMYYKIIATGKDDLKKIYDVTEGLENKIFDNVYKYNNLNDFILSIKSKRYTYARIRRILLNILLDIKYKDIDFLKGYNNNYVKTLAFSENGKDIIKQAKENGTTVITKYSDYKRNGIEANNDKIFELTNKSSNLYYLPFRDRNNYLNNEYYNNVIYIK
ncbi:nucleotidyltransferase [Sedimentibacter sp. zth1]|uniref:nucleotidyltransferase n=1 Tax=Sedimentibacter sp. zth1 TaxID=2816908 RepID=UPI001A912A8C|nr:nucleotidyltransferase [Sedimentibacter sp. zth1]QSX06606.1 nucleotidyltransferase [Sedimentibacter sp. zth1]